MNFLIIYFILGLAISSFAQWDVHQLFQADISTNAEGGCKYISTRGLNFLLQDCLRLADSFIAAIDDSLNILLPVQLQTAAHNLIYAFFKPSNLNDLNILKGIYFFL